MNNDYTPELLQVMGHLRRQLCLYELIGQLTARQKAAIEGSDVDTLSGILAEKQKYLDEIGRLQQQVAVCRASWDAIKETVAASVRDDLRSLSDRIASRLQQAVALEKEAIALATARREEVAQRLHSIRQHRGAMRSYSGGAGRSGSAGLMDRTL